MALYQRRSQAGNASLISMLRSAFLLHLLVLSLVSAVRQTTTTVKGSFSAGYVNNVAGSLGSQWLPMGLEYW
jgi:hypothetical protein